MDPTLTQILTRLFQAESYCDSLRRELAEEQGRNRTLTLQLGELRATRAVDALEEVAPCT